MTLRESELIKASAESQNEIVLLTIPYLPLSAIAMDFSVETCGRGLFSVCVPGGFPDR